MVQSAVAEKVKECYEVAKAKADQLRVQETKRKAELQQLLDTRMTQLQET